MAYTEDNIRSLDWKEHIRMRPGMYIGKLGDGSSRDDGIYVLLKEVLDNSIDEYVMGNGRTIEIKLKDGAIGVRDYGRGIPLGKVIDCVSKINTGGKYDSKAFKKSVGLNGVGTKAVNALAEEFIVESYREDKVKVARFQRGILIDEQPISEKSARSGTYVWFKPDPKIFPKYEFIPEFIEAQLWNYAYLNSGLKLKFNDKEFYSENGLLDLLNKKTAQEKLYYPIIHLKGDDIEIALTHGHHYGEQYYSFVNGQNTTQGGTHLTAFREAVIKTVRDHYGNNYDTRDIRNALIGAVSIRVEEPVFESQTKTKLGSRDMGPDGISIRSFLNDFIGMELDNYLHKNPEVAENLKKRILRSRKERQDIDGIKKQARAAAKKASIHNKKLRDCRFHLSDKRGDQALKEASTIFITEGDSASGSITKARNVETQAVFSLRGKPLNCYDMTKKIVYQNEEFNLLQHALDIEESLENLRYNRVVISTDADVDGMHIRLLLLTFFLQFFPDLVRNNHLYIFNTPLFRVRDKNTTIYCYSEEEKQAAIKKLRGTPEITRFKGLGEISPEEFEQFIGEDIRLEPVVLNEHTNIDEVLEYYMGKNTRERQEFIIDNLRVEYNDLIEEKDLEQVS